MMTATMTMLIHPVELNANSRWWEDRRSYRETLGTTQKRKKTATTTTTMMTMATTMVVMVAMVMMVVFQ